MECAECVASWLVGACLVLRKLTELAFSCQQWPAMLQNFGMVEPNSDVLTLFLKTSHIFFPSTFTLPGWKIS